MGPLRTMRAPITTNNAIDPSRLPLVTLAEWTSRIILVVFAIVCLSLLRLKLRGEPAPEGAFRTPTWVPAAGVSACLALLGLDFLVG